MMELRNTVLKEVQAIQNEELLASILMMIRWNQDKSEYVLEGDQAAGVEIARQQYKGGKLKSHRQLMDETSKWLHAK